MQINLSFTVCQKFPEKFMRDHEPWPRSDSKPPSSAGKNYFEVVPGVALGARSPT